MHKFVIQELVKGFRKYAWYCNNNCSYSPAFHYQSKDLYIIELILGSHPWLNPKAVVDFAILAMFNHSQDL